MSISDYRKKKNPVEKEVKGGDFVPMESRKEVALELKKTHFSLGNDRGKLALPI